jgi:hypothetical protein
LQAVDLPFAFGSGSFVEVMQRLCHRCRTVIHIEDDGTLVFCGNCGAPQVMVSEELLEQAQRANAAMAERTGERVETETERTARIAAQPPDLLVVWKSVIRIAAVVAAILSAICLALPMWILAWLAPGIVLGVYCGRHRETSITAAVGARIGLICGILCAFGIMVAETAQLFILRFGLHRGASFDDTFMQALVLAKTNAAARSGAAATDAFFTPLLTVPEFRVGYFLSVILLGVLILLVLSTASGAFSGLMRSRKTLR